MTLSQRIAARRCTFIQVSGETATGCEEPKAPDADVCERHLSALWRNELDRRDDGTYVARRRLPAKDYTSAA